MSISFRITGTPNKNMSHIGQLPGTGSVLNRGQKTKEESDINSWSFLSNELRLRKSMERSVLVSIETSTNNAGNIKAKFHNAS